MAQLLLVELVVGRVRGSAAAHDGLGRVEHGELRGTEEAGEEVLARGDEGDDEEGDEEAEGGEVDGPAEACAG